MYCRDLCVVAEGSKCWTLKLLTHHSNIVQLQIHESRLTIRHYGFPSSFNLTTNVIRQTILAGLQVIVHSFD